MKLVAAAFKASQAQSRAALITHLTAGFPSVDETPEIMLAMQAGGADIIELGIPFEEPKTVDPVGKSSNATAYDNGIRIPTMLQIVQSARSQGLNVPVVLMGYYEPIRDYAFGEEKLLRDCKAAGVDGFIIVDFPPDDAARFSESCKAKGLSYIPVLAFATPEDDTKTLCKSATSFVYLVSQVGFGRGFADLDEGFPELLKRIRRFNRNGVSSVIGFGATNSSQFLRLACLADGVAVGRPIVFILENAPPGTGAQKVKEYCLRVADRAEAHVIIPPGRKPVNQSMSPTTVYLAGGDGADDSTTPEGPDKEQKDCKDPPSSPTGLTGLDSHHKALRDCLAELEAAWKVAYAEAIGPGEYHPETKSLDRLFALYLARKATESANGSGIWLKAADSDEGKSHNINTAISHVIFAKSVGKTSFIAGTAVGEYGQAVATHCARLGLKCTIFMGSEDYDRSLSQVRDMRLRGTTVTSVDGKHGKGKLCDAANKAFGAWIANYESAFFIVGSVFGSGPCPTETTFQSAIDEKLRPTFELMCKMLPNIIVTGIGGKSDSASLPHEFMEESEIALLEVAEDFFDHKSFFVAGVDAEIHVNATGGLADAFRNA
ncbi:hypothetical protein N7452_002889 [Penicillium brevicompactum]|uniref:tryptophan synthase n=1 Tax=Penicillium brevicompactum TaxID=5074 RepID=A0A9W9QSI0_PENBR|nr:hypothetical protein N7452_002889 [Penicillium brevicompactum]